MRKRTLLFILLGLLLIPASFLLLNWFQKPIHWTQQNSLYRATSPLPGDDGQIEPLLTAIDYSLDYFKRLPITRTVAFGEDVFTIGQVKDSLLDFREKLIQFGLTKQFFEYVQQNFYFYRSAAKKVLLTGYYEALLHGSLSPSQRYRWPLYKKPGDLYRINLAEFPFYENVKDKDHLPRVLRGRLSSKDDKTIVPYYSRDDIDNKNKLDGKDLEIVWVDDPVDLFFLQIQGSGVVELDTGDTIRVNYAEANGHPYRAIGRLLLERGNVPREQLSMQGIRRYLEEHPGEMEEIFNYNPSYVFFRVVERGPLGFIEVPLTPYRSIALDYRLFPKGGLCYVETELPQFDEKGELSGWKTYRAFMMHQDTGGAIRTPARLDFFFGRGQENELMAGHMKRTGQFYFLIKKQ